MTLELLAPEALWLLALCPLLAAFPRRWQPLRAVALRSLVFALVVLALARPVQRVVDGTEHHVLLLDASASVDEAALRAGVGTLEAALAGLPAGAEATLFVLGGADGLTRTERIRATGDQDALQRPWPDGLEPEALGGAASPLGPALTAAHLRIPLGARGSVTLASDGLDTDGGWRRAVGDLASRGLPLHVLALAPDRAPRLLPPRPEAPARLGGRTRLRVDVLNASRLPGARVVLRVDGAEVAREPVAAKGGRARVVLTFEPERSGFLALEVALVAEGGESQPLRSLLPVDAPARGLVVGAAGRSAADLAALQALVGPAVRLERQAEGAPLPDLADLDLVLLDDRAAEDLPVGFDVAVAAAVRDGGLGLFAAGTNQAFGAGGWQDTALGDVLPVEALQKEEKRDPSVALAIVIDTSGSMGGNRVQLAKETARLAMRRLLPHDKVGIVEFYGAKRWAAPIQPASNNIELERALNRLAAGGGTVILPAIEEAFYGLLNVDARYKHVLVLTDGGVESGAFEPLLRRMASRGITTSTVLIGGSAHSEFLVTLANWGKGRFYGVPDRFNLPEILLKQPTSAKLSAVRPGAAALQARGGTAWWGDGAPDALPALESLVETERRPYAEAVLETADGARPVVASWRYGLGRVTAMPTEPLGPGTRGLDAWPDYGRFLGRALERTARDLEPFVFRVEREGLEVRVLAQRRAVGDAPLEPRAALVLRRDPGVAADDPGAETRERLHFERRAPGLFEARLFAAPDEELAFEGGLAGSGSARAAKRFVSRGVLEPDVDPAAALDLALLAAATGGQELGATGGSGDSAATALAAGGAGRALRLREWRPWLLLLALLAYGLDLYDRRRARTATAPGATS